MTLQIEPDLASLLAAEAKSTGMTVEAPALEALRKEVTPPTPRPQLSHAESVRLLDEVAIDSGASLPADRDRESIYD